MKKLGIVGGMGPYATALFYKKLIELTSASTDQEHIECIIYSAAQVPDRTAFLKTATGAESPLDRLFEVCHMLEKHVDILAMPCMTSHHFYDDLSSSVSVPFLDMHRICADEAAASALGIMATEGTLASGRLLLILREHGIEPVLPSNQAAVTKLIYDVKAGKPYNPDLFNTIAHDLEDKGALKVLLGCSELQVYVGLANNPPLLDATELLARRCIMAAGGRIK